MSTPIGVNPVTAMSKADQAEELAIRTTAAAPALEGIIEDLQPAVSSYVTSGLFSFDTKMFDNISQLAQNSINLAENIKGADLEIAATDHDSAEEFQEGLGLLDITINF
ncbi:hypothetical protein [Nocardiopsis sp. NPDC057823]|uniref:hypothetical protein n=1 Tax=Nocardiopsis sp. NPDC057823 TaxID=3346256 RepID=UPI0036719D96